MTPLTHDQWRPARAAYVAQVEAWVSPRLARRAVGAKHPVDDFLFDYYPISPGKLRMWHPGVPIAAYPSDITLFARDVYQYNDGIIEVNPMWVAGMRERIAATEALLKATAGRTALSGCFGLHEWAMVWGSSDIRHAQYPLRVTQDDIGRTIDEVGLQCTHFDAFRFFTAEAAPRNPLQLTRALQVSMEQPGCLHANMDLYKHAMALAPLVGSAVVHDAFELAREIREVDMRAAPYDLRDLGIEPICIETAAGRAQFAALQRQFATRAAAIRLRILEEIGAAVTLG